MLLPPPVVVGIPPGAPPPAALPRRLAEVDAEGAIADAIPIQGLDGGGRLHHGWCGGDASR